MLNLRMFNLHDLNKLFYIFSSLIISLVEVCIQVTDTVETLIHYSKKDVVLVTSHSPTGKDRLNSNRTVETILL